MEPLLKKEEINSEKVEALKRALIGVKDKREEAFILLNAVPEEYLEGALEYFRILTGIIRIDSLDSN
jgi:hypothetical protein